MLVRDLIRELQKFDQGLHVTVEGFDVGYEFAGAVKTIHVRQVPRKSYCANLEDVEPGKGKETVAILAGHHQVTP